MDDSNLDFSDLILPSYSQSWYELEDALYHPDRISVEDFQNLISNFDEKQFPAIEIILICASSVIKSKIEKFAEFWSLLNIKPDKLNRYSYLYDYLTSKGLIEGESQQTFNEFSKNDIKTAIYNDDVSFLSVLSIQPNFGTIEDMLLVDYAAACGSFNCYFYLKSGQQKISKKTLMAALLGGNESIIGDVLDSGIKLEKDFIKFAVIRHHDTIVNWILNEYQFKLPLIESLEFLKNPSLVYIVFCLKSKLCDYKIFRNYAYSMIYKGCDIIMRLLVDFGNLEIPIKTEIFEYSVKKGFPDLTKSLIDKLDNKYDYADQFNVAAKENHLDVMKVLLPKIVQIDRYGDDGTNPLLNSCGNGNYEMFMFLIENGSDITLTDNDNRTSLSYAVSGKNLEIIKYLLESGININTADKNGKTPLMYAVKTKDFELVKYLISIGAEINHILDNGLSAVSLSITYSNSDIFFYLSKTCHANLDHILDKSYLISAALEAKLFDVASYLIDIGVDVNKCDKNGLYPIFKAITCNNIDIFKTLYETVDDIYVHAPKNMNILHSAVSQGNKEIVEFIISQDFPLNDKNESGETALYISVENGFYDITEMLLENGVDVNAKDYQGYTPLMAAVKRKDEETIILLMRYGSDVNIISKRGDTAFSLANDEYIESLIKGDWLRPCLLI
ncbi:hypothetical protein TVAG_042010 [Trichomonas vaginalis G3]|uniref:DUF3447 domain-containing protein n=1 Tax=Trichomonas vaginalis (strain ATCC PRA-98 / G3) TaxID=412133 RepID=A2EUU0_TRIV3|nr:spectrin binding [Trichomonas vaginalis G3]EAY03549.1 hypothetical protein TVAG_042010 [Trichomonas vaginalis G3]KAI5550050.1 spectrin binding [Trichomonas vaginalis G3]|eukprot:XP_001315772.1 hypothetical protein [Trichomonas vaginalis G3]